MEWLDPLWFSSAAALVLLIPGASLLAWLPGKRSVDNLLAVLADAAALSISIVALLALWLMITGIKASALGLIIFYSAGVLVLLAALWVRRTQPTGSPARAARFLPWFLAFGLVVGLSAWRFYQARDLALPAWVDSVHHTLVVRKIIEYRGLPPDLNPYFPAAFFYHYGFHLLAALFAFWTRLTPAEAVLWFGSVINAAVGLSVYRAAHTVLSIGEETRPVEETGGIPTAGSSAPPAPRFWNKPTLVAFSAALLTTFVFQMPAYYATWGRYTLLAGLVLLGPTISAAWEAWQKPASKGAAIKLAILVAGLCLTHYFALLLAGIFFLVLGVFGLVPAARWPARRAALLRTIAWIALGLAIASPWVWRVGLGTQESLRVQWINPASQDEPAQQGLKDYLKYLVYLAGPRRNHILLALAGLGLIAAARQRNLRPLAIWALILGLLSLPWGLRLGPFRPDHFAIILFFPASILLGNLLVEGVNALSRLVQPGVLERKWFRPGIFGIILAVFLVWGMRDTRNVLNQTTLIANRSDLAALDWIQAHIPADARFYINSTLWQGNTYRGVDGGYWLMPYTGHTSMVPPALYTTASADFVEEINRWAKAAEQINGCTAAFWNVVEDARLTHIYIHRGKGNLQPLSLENCPGTQVIYHNEEVVIYKIDPAP